MATDDQNVPRLIVTAPAEQAGLVLPLSQPQMVIGHSDTADVVLEDPFVSRRQALVTVDPSGVVTIRDLNSTGGTFVNDERLEGPRVLRPGDLVRFADVVARFEPASSPGVGTAAADAVTQVLPLSAGTDAAPGADTEVTATPVTDRLRVREEVAPEAAPAENSAPQIPATETQAGADPGSHPVDVSATGTAAPGVSVGELQTQLGQLGYAVPASEQQAASLGPGTQAAVEQFQTAHGLAPSGSPDAATAAALAAAIAAATYTVTGMVLSPALPGVSGLTVQLLDKNVGGDQVLASTQTSSDGSYAFSQVVISPAYLAEHHKTQPDLQVQVSAGGNVLAASQVSYSAPVTVSLDVVLPASARGLPSEYETLTANLAAAYPGRLGALKEDAGQQDITYLANKTGWDARAVALAALADQFSQITAPAPVASTDPKQTQVSPVPAVSLRPEFYYALFRAGLPANADGLFQASPATVRAIWQQAITQNVIPQALATDVPGAVVSFQALKAAHSLTAVPPAGVSTLQEMLAPTLPDAARQETFAQLYAQYQGDWASFWPAVEQALGTGPAKQLQLMGQLFHLTVNNQQLVSALTGAEAASPLTAALDLATRGYYDPAKWASLIGASIPPGIPGADASEQAANYAQLLAAQVRLAFPTAVVADQVQRGILPVADTADVAEGVVTFLTSHQGEFEIGVEPVQAYINRTALTGTPAGVITQIKRLQRVYQLTPDDTSMAVLLRHNLDSAFAITRYDSAGFVRTFPGKVGGPGTATAIYARAKQVFASTLSVTVAYLGGRVAPVLGGQVPVHSGFPPQSAAPAYPVIAYPTLEDLFGSLDYCNCTDCGSILSPAAYLVDLLNYIDEPAPTAGDQNPQDVLLERRPDLQYLPLTCENTNTALPYIDIVNETLEYFVANGLSLQDYQGHDTGDSVTSAELIASPQYVNDAAYAILQNAFFPSLLPFNRPLALLRIQLGSLGRHPPGSDGSPAGQRRSAQ